MTTGSEYVRVDGSTPLGCQVAESDSPAGPVPTNASSTVFLTVIVPVYNEVATIDILLSRVMEVPYEKQVIVVDDGSDDGTSTILRRWEGYPGVLLLRHGINRGKGAAIRTGLEKACGRYTLVQDADLEYDPRDYPRLLEPILKGRAHVVYGARFLRGMGAGERPWQWNRVGVAFLNLWLWWLYGVRLTDEASCFKVFPTQVLRQMDLSCVRFEFCPEVTAKACRLGLKIQEVPVKYRPRSVPEGKKIRWQDGVEAAVTLWTLRGWQPRSP